jgi:hypothetical protein
VVGEHLPGDDGPERGDHLGVHRQFDLDQLGAERLQRGERGVEQSGQRRVPLVAVHPRQPTDTDAHAGQVPGETGDAEQDGIARSSR